MNKYELKSSIEKRVREEIKKRNGEEYRGDIFYYVSIIPDGLHLMAGYSHHKISIVEIKKKYSRVIFEEKFGYIGFNYEEQACFNMNYMDINKKIIEDGKNINAIEIFIQKMKNELNWVFMKI